MIKKICAFVILLMIWPSVHSDSLMSIEMKYGFYLDDLHKTPGYIKPIFIFPSIPGSIFGVASEPVLYTEQATTDDRIVIKLPMNIDEFTKPFSADGLSVTPNGAKLLRLGTFHADPNNPDTLGGGAFINVESNNYMILLYAAQSMTIQGTLKSEDDTYAHDLVFRKPGWHWIELVKTARDHYLLKNYSGNLENIEFAVIVPKINAI